MSAAITCWGRELTERARCELATILSSATIYTQSGLLPSYVAISWTSTSISTQASLTVQTKLGKRLKDSMHKKKRNLKLYLRINQIKVIQIVISRHILTDWGTLQALRMNSTLYMMSLRKFWRSKSCLELKWKNLKLEAVSEQISYCTWFCASFSKSFVLWPLQFTL